MAKGSLRDDSGRAQYGSGKPVCGRKHCSRCGCWRHIVDFHVFKRNQRGVIIEWSRQCRACRRIYRRALNAETKRRADIREYHRIWSQGKRRRAGIPERNWKRGGTRDQRSSKNDAVDADPFLAWLERACLRLGPAEGQDPKALGIAMLSRRAGVSDRSVRRIRAEGRVTLTLVDRFVVAADDGSLTRDLYPAEYETT